MVSDRPGWALAFYTGMRRGEIGRSQWEHVFWEADEIMVDASKSDAGEGRRVPMVGPLMKILREEWIRRGQPPGGRSSCDRSIRGSGRRAPTGAWAQARLARVTLHEARHTYASFLMAAGYNLKQIQEYLGHADLVTTGRYIKNLPVPGHDRAPETRRLSRRGGRRSVSRECGHKCGQTCHACCRLWGFVGH